MAGAPLHGVDSPAPVAVVRRRSWRGRVGARAPRLIAGALAIVLMAAGLRATLDGQPQALVPAGQSPPVDIGALAFGEAFARAYLSWNPDAPQLQQAAVARFTSDDLDTGAGVDQRESQTVRWASAAGVQRLGRRELVTVEVETDRGGYQLVVPVERDERDRLAVVGYPALVGTVATALSRELPDLAEVADTDLREVIERALRNYIAGQRRNLLADLDPSAVVSLPARPLEVRSVDDISWARRPRRVAVKASVADGHTVLTLTYEMAVVRSDRWYVRAIATDPTNPPPRRTR